jgi:hypothetical protein
VKLHNLLVEKNVKQDCSITSAIGKGAADVHEKCEPQVSRKRRKAFAGKRKLVVGFRGVFFFVIFWSLP